MKLALSLLYLTTQSLSMKDKKSNKLMRKKDAKEEANDDDHDRTRQRRKRLSRKRRDECGGLGDFEACSPLLLERKRLSRKRRDECGGSQDPCPSKHETRKRLSKNKNLKK